MGSSRSFPTTAKGKDLNRGPHPRRHIFTDVLAGAPVLIAAERDVDEALAAGFVVAGANGVAPPM
jgi:hypothetical protein